MTVPSSERASRTAVDKCAFQQSPQNRCPHARPTRSTSSPSVLLATAAVTAPAHAPLCVCVFVSVGDCDCDCNCVASWKLLWSASTGRPGRSHTKQQLTFVGVSGTGWLRDEDERGITSATEVEVELAGSYEVPEACRSPSVCMRDGCELDAADSDLAAAAVAG